MLIPELKSVFSNITNIMRHPHSHFNSISNHRKENSRAYDTKSTGNSKRSQTHSVDGDARAQDVDKYDYGVDDLIEDFFRTSLKSASIEWKSTDDDFSETEEDLERTPSQSRSPITEWKKSPTADDEMADEIYRRLRSMERNSVMTPDFLQFQLEISEGIRLIVIDWLVDLTSFFKLKDEVVFLAINVLDRFLAISPSIPKRKMQLIGSGALVIAAKCEEEQGQSPSFEDVVYMSDGAFSQSELVRMEASILKELNFHVRIPSIITFLPYVLNESGWNSQIRDSHFGEVIMYICHLALMSSAMQQFLPSIVAKGVMRIAMVLNEGSSWLSLWEESSDDEPHRMLVKLLSCDVNPNRRSKCTAVRRKFRFLKFGLLWNVLKSL